MVADEVFVFFYDSHYTLVENELLHNVFVFVFFQFYVFHHFCFCRNCMNDLCCILHYVLHFFPFFTPSSSKAFLKIFLVRNHRFQNVLGVFRDFWIAAFELSLGICFVQIIFFVCLQKGHINWSKGAWIFDFSTYFSCTSMQQYFFSFYSLLIIWIRH